MSVRDGDHRDRKGGRRAAASKRERLKLGITETIRSGLWLRPVVFQHSGPACGGGGERRPASGGRNCVDPRVQPRCRIRFVDILENGFR